MCASSSVNAWHSSSFNEEHLCFGCCNAVGWGRMRERLLRDLARVCWVFLVWYFSSYQLHFPISFIRAAVAKRYYNSDGALITQSWFWQVRLICRSEKARMSVTSYKISFTEVLMFLAWLSRRSTTSATTKGSYCHANKRSRRAVALNVMIIISVTGFWGRREIIRNPSRSNQDYRYGL